VNEHRTSNQAFSDRLRRFLIQLSAWEYWPQWLVYLPLTLYYIFLAIKARSFFFFSAANPGIETGGMFFESKWDVLAMLPSTIVPPTIFISGNEPPEKILLRMEQQNIGFPAIAKPDRGERGWKVKKIENLDDLEEYCATASETFLIQAYIDYPMEFSLFYYRYPWAEKGKVSSLTLKKMLSVTGDGRSTLQQLILASKRAFLQKDLLLHELGNSRNRMLASGEEFLLVPYGNHARGATFLNVNHEIDAALEAQFDKICSAIPDFFYGRFDLRVRSLEDLKSGTDIAVLELNGTGAEPAHIYHPGYSFFKAQQDLFKHYNDMYRIATYNHQKNGVRYLQLKEYFALKKQEKMYKNFHKLC
jgi:hypothetical protein